MNGQSSGLPTVFSGPLNVPFFGGGGAVFRQGGYTEGGVQAGSICHFAFALVLQCLGVSRYRDAGQEQHEKCHCHTPCCVPQMPVKNRTQEQCPHMRAGEARDK